MMFDRLYIHGSKGCIISDVEYNQAGDVCYRIITDNEVTERKISVPQNYSLEVAQLGSCILKGEAPYVSPGFSLRNSKLMDKVFEEIGYYK